MKHCKLAFALLMVFAAVSERAALGLEVYDNIGQPVSNTSSFQIGNWPALSFMTTSNEYVLDSVTIPIRQPVQGSDGQLWFELYDGSGPSGAPGSAIGSILGQVPIANISKVGFENITFTGLNRTLSASTNYWVVLKSAGGVSQDPNKYEVGATTSSGGILTGSLGFSITSDSGATWTAPSTAVHIIGRVGAVAVPEPSTYVLGTIGVIVSGWIARSKRKSSAK